MSADNQLEVIDRLIAKEQENHRRRIEQLRQQKQRIKDAQAKKKEQEKLQKKYKECIEELYYILTE